MKSFKRSVSLICCICMVLAMTLMPGKAYAASTANYKVDVTYGQTEARSMLADINALRTNKNGKAWYWNEDNKTKTVFNTSGNPTLKALVYDYELEKVAMKRAAEVAISFAHERPDGTAWSTAYPSSIFYYSRGENIAAGQSDANAAFVAWCEENCDYSGQGHRRNMLNQGYNIIGIGHCVLNGTHYWVQEFGKVDAPVTKATTANEKKTRVTVKIISSKLTCHGMKSEKSEIAIDVGASVDAPAVYGSYTVANHWPSGNNVRLYRNLTWSSNKTAVVTVSSGKLYGKSKGIATLSVKSGSYKATCTVNVGHYVGKPSDFAAASKSYNSVKLTWKKALGATGYIIYRSDSSDGTYSEIATIDSASTLSYIDKGLLCGSIYYYKIKAFQSSGGKKYNGKLSAAVKGKPVPAKPALTAKKASSTSIKLSWKSVSGAHGYEIYRSTSKTGTYKLIKTTDKLAFTDSKLKKGKTYYYKVRAYREVKGKTVYGFYSAIKNVAL